MELHLRATFTQSGEYNLNRFVQGIFKQLSLTCHILLSCSRFRLHVEVGGGKRKTFFFPLQHLIEVVGPSL